MEFAVQQDDLERSIEAAFRAVGYLSNSDRPPEAGQVSYIRRSKLPERVTQAMTFDSLVDLSPVQLKKLLAEQERLLACNTVEKLPDKGAKIRSKVEEIKRALSASENKMAVIASQLAEMHISNSASNESSVLSSSSSSGAPVPVVNRFLSDSLQSRFWRKPPARLLVGRLPRHSEPQHRIVVDAKLGAAFVSSSDSSAVHSVGTSASNASLPSSSFSASSLSVASSACPASSSSSSSFSSSTLPRFSRHPVCPTASSALWEQYRDGLARSVEEEDEDGSPADVLTDDEPEDEGNGDD